MFTTYFNYYLCSLIRAFTTEMVAKWSFLNSVFGSFDVGFGPPCFELSLRMKLLFPNCFFCLCFVNKNYCS